MFSVPPVAQGTTTRVQLPAAATKKDEPNLPRGNWNDPEPFLEPKKDEPKKEEPKKEEPKKPNPQVPGGGGPDPFPVEPVKPKPPKAPPRYAEVTPLPIKPAKLAEESVEVKLPGKVADTCSGGGGRFLIAHLSDVRKLAIFDVTEGKVVKYLELAAGSVRFAAGMNKLVVAYPDQNQLVRYDLTTFEKEDTQPSPTDGTIKKVAMGSASAGPLLVALSGGNGNGFGGQSRLEFVDPTTFRAVDLAQEQGQNWRQWAHNDHFRASPDGRVFTVHGGSGITSFTIREAAVKQHQNINAYGHVTPGPDGNLYTGCGLFTQELKRIGRQPATGAPSLVPAAEGHLHLHISPVAPDRTRGVVDRTAKSKWKAEVKMTGEERTVYTFKDLDEVTLDGWTSNVLPPDARLHFAPTAHLLVCVPSTNDRLVLRKYDLLKSFEQSGVDYLYVSSRPRTVVPGRGFEYQIDAMSKRGGVRCKLDAGPKGLAVSEAGKVTWAAPADFKEPEQVIVTVSDSSGQEVFHSFELVPGDGKGFAGPSSETAKAAVRGGSDQPDPKAVQALVPAPDRVFEIKPPMVHEKAAVPLSGPADAVCVGGGGRFLIYRLGTKKTLAVLDVTLGRVVKHLPLVDSDALVAAGMTKLFVFNKSARVLQRYDLVKFEKELTTEYPLGGTPGVLLMGHASEGPLYVGGLGVNADANTKGYGFINTRSMKEMKVPLEGDGKNGQPVAGPAAGDPYGNGRGLNVAVSPDGRAYTWMEESGGCKVMILGEKTGRVLGGGDPQGARGPLVPGPDGHLFSPFGLYSPELKFLGDTKQMHVVNTHVPATSGPWYVSVLASADQFDPSRVKRKTFVALTADDRAKFALDDITSLPAGAVDQWNPQKQAKPPLAARLHLVPEAEILAVLDDGMEKVHLHRVRVNAEMEKSAGDNLMVVSRPPPAVRGQKWAYTPDVWSKKGGVKVKVDSGPDGMKATGGTVSWDVPAKSAGDEPAVILTVSDASGQESFHTFTLSIRAPGQPVMTVIKPAPPAVDPIRAIDPNALKPKAVTGFPLRPTAAKDGTDVDLPAAADHACLAGGGRFILFRIPSKKLVAVFDVVDGKVVKELAMAEDGATVAGGRSFALVINPKAGLVQRWNLSTFEKEATTKLPDGFAPQVVVMGHASEGPMFLGSHQQFGVGPSQQNGFYDPLTLKKIDLKKSADASVIGEVKPNLTSLQSDAVTCSPDGRVWAWWNKGDSPTGLNSLVIDGDTARGFRSLVSVGPTVVGSDGALFNGAGVFASDQSRVIEAIIKGVKVVPVSSWREVRFENGGYNPPLARTPVPAADGPFYLAFRPDVVPPRGLPRAQARPTSPSLPEAPPLLRLVGSAGVIGELKGLRGMDDPIEDPTRPRPGPRPGQPDADRPPLLAHQRTFLIPSAELMAVLSPDGTKIHIHTFQARDLIDKSGQEYLLVMGRPPQFATPGQKWSYTPEVWSKKGGVKVEVMKGPAGMQAVGGGVEWAVPADLLDHRVTVDLRVTDASGGKVTLGFALSLDGTTPPPTVIRSEGVTQPKRAEPGKEDSRMEKIGTAAKPDDTLFGTWAVDKFEYGGPRGVVDASVAPELAGVRFTFEKDGTSRSVGVSQSGYFNIGTFATDPSAKPKAIDLTSPFKKLKDGTQLAVYEVTGDVLKLCRGLDVDAPRPTALAAVQGETVLITLKRVKDEPKKPEPGGSVPSALPKDPKDPKDPKAQPPKAADPAKRDDKDEKIVGTWGTDKVEVGGRAMPIHPAVAGMRHIFDKDGGVRVTGGPEELTGTYKLDTSVTPKAIDMTLKSKGGAEQKYTAVYEIDGTALRLSMPPVPGGVRPNDLKGTGTSPVMTLKRVEDPKK